MNERVHEWGEEGKPTVEKNRHSPTRMLRFMKEVLPWMDEQDRMVGYAWFAFVITSRHGRNSALFDAEGGLTELGRFYSDYLSR